MCRLTDSLLLVLCLYLYLDDDYETVENAVSGESGRSIRLPQTVIPEHYTLTFHPHIYETKEDSFYNDGWAEIKLKCIEKTDTIVLHSKRLNWTAAALTDNEDNGLGIAHIGNFTEEEMVEIKVDEYLKANNTYHLYIAYSNSITDNLIGFYYSPYKENNTTKYIFTTMMEPTDARRVFPCFDEPDFKAVFQINIIRRKTIKSLSNAHIDTTEEINDVLVKDVYANSPKMSTYLVAFAIGDIDYLETLAGDTQFRTWCRRGAVHLTEFALDVGSKLMTYFEDYFQISYSLPKADMIAVPTMIFNAMEHWGMITYREAGMLYEVSVSSEADKQWIAIIVAHELSHQWFGNIVSPKWWDDLWLNEGFATYMMFLAVDAVFPDWKMMQQLAVDYRGVQNVMAIDDVLTSHPVYVPVSHPNEINEIFDLISYAKGCAVIQMMNFFLGDSTFNKGLTRYLQDYSYSTATHNDLWRVLGQQSLEDGNQITDVKSIMDTWLLEKNYPVVTITRTSATAFTMSQMAFLLEESGRQNRSNIFWEIPFAYTHERELDFDKQSTDIIWLHKNGAEVLVEDTSLENSSWIIGNVQQHGFFRVNYELENWNAILNQLKTNHLVIDPVNRAQIIDDAWNLKKAGLLDFDTALRTLEYLDQEVDFVPWKAALKELNFLRKSLQLTPAYGDFMAFMQKKLANAYSQSIAADSHYGKIQSSQMATQSCGYGMKACEEMAMTEFENWISNVSYNVNPDLKTAVYCTGVKLGGASVWDKVLIRYQETTSASERQFLLQALACVKEPWVIKKFLYLTVFANIFSTNDMMDGIDYISRNPLGRLMVWDFVVENWDYYFKRYGSSLNLFAKLIKSSADAYNTVTELNKIESFIRDHDDLGTADREFKNAVVKIKINIAWMGKHYEDLQQWLQEQTK